MVYLAPERVHSVADVLAKNFAEAEPFPHVVIDDALALGAPELAGAFPDPEWEGWHRYVDANQHRKMVCSDIDAIPGPFRGLVGELNGPRFLRFLEKVSGIPDLLPDPYLEGGGLHCSGPGGVLTTHTDFHVSRLGLYRRLNLLLYLNESWEQDWGGCLELYAPGADGPGSKPRRTVVPEWGTCVIFRTDHRSPHGFTKPIADGRWRRSVALYYYTAAEAQSFSGDHNTYWRISTESGLKRRMYRHIYRSSMSLSSGFSQIAHRFNPQAQPPPKQG